MRKRLTPEQAEELSQISARIEAVTPGSRKVINYERRCELVAMPCTLDGKPARVSGTMLDFASVATTDSKGGKVEFAWATVEHILTTRNGAFRS